MGEAVQTDAVIPESLPQLADDAGRIVCFQADVIAVFRFVNRRDFADVGTDRQLEVLGEVRQFDGAGDIDDIADDCAGRRVTPRAWAHQHDFADGAAADENGVVDTFDAYQRMVQGNEHRMCAHVKLRAFARLRQPDHFDAIAKFVGQLNIQIADLGDALSEDLADFNRRLESQRGKDGNLVNDIKPFNVVGRIGFGKPGGLGFAQGFGKGFLLQLHLGQDVVGRAVDDAGDARDTVGLQTALQRRNQRNATADRRFKKDRGVVLIRQREKFWSVFGDKFFVSGDNVFAVGECALDDGVHWVYATDDFNDDFDGGVIGEFERVVRQREGFRVNLARFVAVGDGDAANVELRIVAQQADDARADGAQADDAKSGFVGHKCSVFSTG